MMNKIICFVDDNKCLETAFLLDPTHSDALHTIRYTPAYSSS